MLSNIKSNLLILFILAFSFASATYATSFGVGVNKGNANPVAIVDEDGNSINATNPLAFSYPVVSTITDSRKTVASGGTPEALAASSTPFNRCVVTALEGNTDTIVIGSETVDATLATRTGIPLYSSEKLTLYNGDLADYYMDVEVNAEGVSIFCES